MRPKPERSWTRSRSEGHARRNSTSHWVMDPAAVTLGTPVLTVFEGRLGAVDERLIAQGRLQKLEDPDQVRLAKRSNGGTSFHRVRRDPGLLSDLLLG